MAPASPPRPDLTTSDEQAELVAELEAKYAEALAVVKSDARESVSPEVRRQCAQTLGVLNKELRRVRRLPRGQQEKRAWREYPCYKAVPRCPRDGRYVRSFRLDEADAARAFFDEHGFVVFDGVVSGEECDATVAEIWGYLEERTPGLARGEPETWALMSSERYGLPEAQAVFTPQVAANRQNPNVYAALDSLLPRVADDGGPFGPHPSRNSVVVSQDRWCVYRPARDRPDWRTSENLHLDVNPWAYSGLEPSGAGSLRYGAGGALQDRRFPLQDFRTEANVVEAPGPHVQGLLNLLDNREEDGGTRVVPGFHRCFPAWLRALGGLEENLAQSSPHDNWVLRRPCGGGSFKFSDEDPIHRLSQRVPLRAGSLLLWNHCTVHGSRANRSDNFRMAQFIRGFRAGELDEERAWARAASVAYHNSQGGAPLLPLAPHVFGDAGPELAARPAPRPGP